MDLHAQAHALHSSAGVRALSELAVIRVTGDDAREWLNGQITNDVREPRPGSATYALVVDLRGRIVADLHVLDEGESFSLVVPREVREALVEHLDGYVIMEDVELEPDARAVLTVQGPEAGAVVGEREAWPSDRLGEGGRDLLLAPDELAGVEAELIAAAEALGGGSVTEGGWHLGRLRGRVPRFGPELGPTVYPQEAGLDATAVSFAKGCYVGQEPIVMLKHRGKTPRKLCRLSSEGAALAAGAELSGGGRVVGALTSVALDPDSGRWLALAYVKRAHATVGASLTIDGREGGGHECTVDAVLANDER